MKKFTILTAIFLCTAWMAYGQWTFTSLSEPKAYMGVTVLGAYAYFAGGSNDSGLKSTVEIYDAQAGQWKPSGNLSVARELPFATACGSKVIFAGGVDFYGTGAVYSTVDIYDTITQIWTVKQLSLPRLQAAVVSHGTKVLFAGGTNYQTGATYDIVEIYDFETEEWSFASLSIPRVVWWAKVGDLAIFAGGYSAQQSSKRVDIYNFTTNTWSIDSLSVPRAFIGMTTIGNKVLIAGGMTSGNTASNVVDIYDASTGTWDVANLSLARAFADNQQAVTAAGKAYFVGGGKIHLTGGYWTAAYNVIDIYDEVTNTWSVDTMPLSPRVHHAVVANNNKVIIAGGYLMTPPNGCDTTVAIYTCPPTSCLPEGITFTTQEEIDNFQADHPGCTEIEGDVVIGNIDLVTDIDHLDSLNVLTSILGSLTITNNPIASLSGLENLDYIGGNFFIGGYYWGGECKGNNNLVILAGLNGLDSIGGDLVITCNEALANLTGLESLTKIGGTLNVGKQENTIGGGNPSLVNLTGLTSLTHVPNIIIRQNSALTSLTGLTSLSDFQNINIRENSALTSLTGLEGLTSIEGNLYIEDNPITSLFGVNNLSYVGGYLFLGNTLLENLSELENLEFIGGSLRVAGNNQLISLSGLGNLDSIGGWLSIGSIYGVGIPPPPGGNDVLNDLSALINLKYVGEGIDIGYNSSLSSLAGLENINAATITDLLIGYNFSLSSCEVQSVCDYLSSPNGTVVIEYNAPGCNSPEEVEAACDAISVEERNIQNEVSIFPNPGNGLLNFSFAKGVRIDDVIIYNKTGQKVLHGIPSNNTLDFSKLSPGIYFIKIISDQSKTIQKLIIQ